MADHSVDASYRVQAAAAHPAMTLPMLIDSLADCEILHVPNAASRRLFNWFATVASDGTISCNAPVPISDARLLFVCKEAYAIDVLRERPQAFVLVLSSAPRSVVSEAARAFPDRTVVVRQATTYSFFALEIQSVFTQLLLWEIELDRIVARQGTLTEMLDVSANVLRNFLFVSDGNLNLLAHSSLVEPPDDFHRRIVEAGCFTPEMLEERRQRLPEQTFYTQEPSALTPYARLSQPIYLAHTYFGSLSMSCCARPLTEGVKDTFSVLARYVTILCERMWRDQMRSSTPQYFFFERLLKHESVSASYVDMQLSSAGLTSDMQFKLVEIDVDPSVNPTLATQVIRAASNLNHGNVFPFIYEDHVLALLYARPSDSLLSHSKTLAELEERIWIPFSALSAISSVFTDITDLDLAHRQTQIALSMRGAIDAESQADGTDTQKRAYLFDDAFLYWLVSPEPKDERFQRFCFSYTVARVLYEEDQRNGTDHFELLWLYLLFERNATMVANRMHVHRNTVLYHIDRIQKRFDIDLSVPATREHMLLDYKALLLATKHVPLGKDDG